ncbi:type II secretion system minor pseudopilin GspK [Xanthomonadaceae bacterium JHOS43]|nr:type II secretion system minor pseudopilin GspK [Xanthomonadaceae bacterium JHOS43]MCX7562949.1 type II secretion system minor pseudopilin GspK [Xanthomonadaceae bacterium XH05]
MSRQRGVALIAAVLVVALATVLIAAMLDRSEAALARTRNLQRAEQGWELMRGVEAWAASVLRQDFSEAPDIDSREDIWNQDMPPIDLPGVRIFGRLIERNGCFNLNALHVDGDDDSIAMARFERLLRALRLDPVIAQQVADWIDADAIPRTNGVEDGALLARRPALRAANQPFVHVSELRLLPAVSHEVYDTLAPHVCAAPGNSTINLNFASPEVWMSLSDSITPSIAERLAREGRANYSSLDAVVQELAQLGIAQVPLNGYDVGSDRFVLEVQIVADGIPFLYSSLLLRRPDGVHVVARARGRF